MSAAPEITVGVDLGGTNVRAGAVTAEGQLLEWAETLIEARRGPQAGVERIASLVEKVSAGRKLLAVGIGATGPIDRQRGAIQNPYTLPTWEDVDIVQPLRQAFGVPVALENDADAAALGEWWQGAGRGVQRLLAVTVGTGIGTAFIYRGHIYRGVEGWHGEGGHMRLDPNGPPCYCGGRGCWESLAAGPAIARDLQAAVRQKPSSRMLELAGGEVSRVDAAVMAQAARQGDPLALEWTARLGAIYGMGLVNLILLLLPDAIVLGGGVMRSFDLFEEPIRAAAASVQPVVPAERVTIQPAQLGQQAGVLGAARAALDLLQETA